MVSEYKTNEKYGQIHVEALGSRLQNWLTYFKMNILLYNKSGVVNFDFNK